MRKIEELNEKEYIDLACGLTDDEENAREYCKHHNIDFEEVKRCDWGYDWQIGHIGAY